MSLRTIEVAVELVGQMEEWSEPVRVRYVEAPMPMLELQTVDLLAAVQETFGGTVVDWCAVCGATFAQHAGEEHDYQERRELVVPLPEETALSRYHDDSHTGVRDGKSPTFEVGGVVRTLADFPFDPLAEALGCPTCWGSGVDGSTFVAGSHLEPSQVDPCPTCEGLGLDWQLLHLVHTAITNELTEWSRRTGNKVPLFATRSRMARAALEAIRGEWFGNRHVR